MSDGMEWKAIDSEEFVLLSDDAEILVRDGVFPDGSVWSKFNVVEYNKIASQPFTDYKLVSEPIPDKPRVIQLLGYAAAYFLLAFFVWLIVELLPKAPR